MLKIFPAAYEIILYTSNIFSNTSTCKDRMFNPVNGLGIKNRERSPTNASRGATQALICTHSNTLYYYLLFRVLFCDTVVNRIKHT